MTDVAALAFWETPAQRAAIATMFSEDEAPSSAAAGLSSTEVTSQAGSSCAPFRTQNAVAKMMRSKPPTEDGGVWDFDGWHVTYQPVAEPIVMPLGTTVLLMKENSYIIENTLELCRYVSTDKCPCVRDAKMQQRVCDKCSWSCLVNVKHNDGNVNPEAILTTESVIEEILLRFETLPPHMAPGNNRRLETGATATAENLAHNVNSARYKKVYYNKPAPNENRGILAPYRWWTRTNCGFTGCKARLYVGSYWEDDTCLYAIETVAHTHACAPCGKCVLGTATSMCTHCGPCDEHPNGDPSSLPCILTALVEVSASSVHANRIQAAATTATQVSGVMASAQSKHRWQMKHIAGGRRGAHASQGPFVGHGATAVHEQQHKNPLVGNGTTKRAGGSDQALILDAYTEATKYFKGEGLLAQLLVTADGFSLIFTTETRALLWKELCESGDPLLPGIDGTGGIGTKVDGKPLWCHGGSIRSVAAALEGVNPPAPLVAMLIISTGCKGVCFKEAWQALENMMEKYLKVPLVPPKAIISDYDGVYLTPLAQLWARQPNYNAYCRHVWHVSEGAHRIYHDVYHDIVDNNPAAAAFLSLTVPVGGPGESPSCAEPADALTNDAAAAAILSLPASGDGPGDTPPAVEVQGSGSSTFLSRSSTFLSKVCGAAATAAFPSLLPAPRDDPGGTRSAAGPSDSLHLAKDAAAASLTNDATAPVFIPAPGGGSGELMQQGDPSALSATLTCQASRCCRHGERQRHRRRRSNLVAIRGRRCKRHRGARDPLRRRPTPRLRHRACTDHAEPVGFLQGGPHEGQGGGCGAPEGEHSLPLRRMHRAHCP
mmetsp:Transcript_19377/g.31361  ORF Transcript_19377/g.31361 Transcript_19377/m.31361 type:complete len:830 (+) Transcript_19377:109-2598(+)